MEKSVEKKDVKSRIVAAAWQLFYEKGYNGTTVDDIIALSDTSKGSFYYYFTVFFIHYIYMIFSSLLPILK